MTEHFDPVQSAFEKAASEFKANLQDDALYDEILPVSSIQQVYDATDKLQEEQAKKGHLRHLSKIQPFLTRLSLYSEALNVFVQLKPDVLPLIWGPIVLLLQWTSVLKTSFDAIVDTTAAIGQALPEFQQASRLFDQNNHIKDVLLLFFKDILDFYLVALKFFRLSRWRYLFEALWPKHREKIKVITTLIERHTLLMRKEVQFEHIQQGHEARHRLLATFENTERIKLLQEFRGIKTDIAPETYDGKLNWLRSRRCKGTGTWLLKDTTFTKWLDVSETSARLLWLQGIPGAGKTFLASTAVDASVAFAKTLFVFLSYARTDSTSALTIFHSLIFQLVSDSEDLQTALCEMTRENLKNNLDVAFKILSALLSGIRTVYIIVDGLDEIDEVERALFVEYLRRVLKECEGVKALIGSRPEVDLKAILKDQAVSIRVDQRNAESIQAYVWQWTKDWLQQYEISQEAKAQIEAWLAPLAPKSKGMFLYAKVILTSIEYLDDFTAIENELTALPESLNDAYLRILSRVNDLHPAPLKEKARKLLGWIACSPAPLTVQEIQQALAIRLNDREGEVRLLIDLKIEKLCGPIIEVSDSFIQFVHFTVKEYILSPQIIGFIDHQEATLSLTMSCITYLCQRHHRGNLSTEDTIKHLLAGSFVLHGFAATNWLELVERTIRFTGESALPPQLISLLQSLLSERINHMCDFNIDNKARPGIEDLRANWPELYEMTSRAFHFRHLCSSSKYKIQEESVLASNDPLTISKTSLLIHKATDSLLDCKAEKHDDGCSCTQIRRLYGNRPFKCSFLHCHLRRHGFETYKARVSHEKRHDRPWKCSVGSCEYADGGFLSRKMRDDHLDWYHNAMNPEPEMILTKPNPTEILPLLTDLVKSNNVDAVKALLRSPIDLSWYDRYDLQELAAQFGSVPLLDLFVHGNFLRDLLVDLAIRGNKPENMEYLFRRYPQRTRSGRYDTDHSKWLIAALRSGSKEIFDVWDKHVGFLYLYRKHEKEPALHEVFHTFCGKKLLSGMKDHLQREQVLLKLWKDKGLLDTFRSSPYLGDTLSNIAETICSVELAKFWIEGGANVDHRRGGKSLTPLHHAAMKDNAEAAEFMKFLLLSGADPEITAGRREKRSIRDEKGARGISKWLGISWDELVAQTKDAREARKERESQTQLTGSN